MDVYRMTNDEVSHALASALKAWRVSPNGAGLTQVDLAHKSGIGLTPLKRFEKTGAITLRNLIAILRAMDLLDGLAGLVPDADSPSPLDVLAEAQKKAKHARKRAPRKASLARE
jgi:hypothetical protein